MKKLTTLEFITKAKLVHGDLFDYSKSDYKGGKQKIIIGCKLHGNFSQNPSDHVNSKQGCPKCGGTEKLNTTSFIEKASTVHNDFYNYSKTDYVNNRTKITITCPIHGDFSQDPSSHLQKVGCPKCGILKNSKSRTKETEEVVSEFLEVHGNRYDYSNVDYISGRDKVKIICKIHGLFEQSPENHAQGQNCPKCANSTRGVEVITTEEYVEICNKVHNNFYDYSLTQYNRQKNTVVIKCPIHGEFTQNAKIHKDGSGCPSCNFGYYSIKRAERHKDKWEKVPAILYFLKIKTQEEEFYKIGLTKKTIDKRFSKDNFQIEVIKDYSTNLYNACILEAVILEENKQYKYKPKTVFTGHTECFNKNILL